MSTVTLPAWFWFCYYLFFFATLVTTIISIAKKKNSKMAFVTILLILTMPIISLINSIGRLEGLHEFEHLLKELLQGSVWAIYVSVGHIVVLVWWGMFLASLIKKHKGLKG